MTKMTIATKFDAVVNLLNGEASALSVEEAVEFLNDRKEKAVKKAGTRKPTAQQKENEGYKATILDILSTEGKTVTEIMASDDTLGGLSNQRVSALLRQLILTGEVVKTKEGKKSLFAIAE